MTSNTTHLVIGCKGQIGSALHTVLSEHYQNTDGIDLGVVSNRRCFDVIHICIPYTEEFNLFVRDYVGKYGCTDTLVIIHSTVPVGTSRKHRAVHSPMRGVHPNLVQGIKTFTKFFGGPKALEARQLFSFMGIDTVATSNSDNTEALKLWDTTYYGWNLVFEKDIHAYCEKHGLDYDLVYTLANRTYNDGYRELGMGEVVRPVFKHVDGPIGGHCVLPNATLLTDSFTARVVSEKGNQGWQSGRPTAKISRF